MAQCRKSNNQHAPSVAPVVFLLNGITLIIKLINLLKLYIHLVQPNWKIYCQLFYPQFTRKTVRRHKICVLLRCFDSMYARYMSFLRALPGTNFMPSDSGDLKRREFLHFQGRRRRRTGSTLIEDNAENEEIIPF